jgi:serine/threonine-protein kinase
MPDENPSDSSDRGLAHDQTLDGTDPAAASHSAKVSVKLELPDWLTNWDRYEILSLLGQGGMGVVYRARDRRLGRVVALKFIRAVSPQTAQRFIQEARAQARIAHENVCKVFEVGEVSGQKYIAMEYLAGEPLHTAQRRLTMRQKLQLIKDLAEALHAAHVLGIIHRGLLFCYSATEFFRRARPGTVEESRAILPVPDSHKRSYSHSAATSHRSGFGLDKAWAHRKSC